MNELIDQTEDYNDSSPDEDTLPNMMSAEVYSQDLLNRIMHSHNENHPSSLMMLAVRDDESRRNFWNHHSISYLESMIQRAQ